MVKSCGAGAFLMLALFMPGCASDVANRYYSEERYEAKNIQDVLILSSRPTRPFIVIADFQSRGENPEDLQEKAAAIGADAVIISYIGGYHSKSEEWISVDRLKGKYYDHIIGTAIKYVSEDE